MKSKQVKKLLSITLASAMMVSGVPTGSLMIEAESTTETEKTGGTQENKAAAANGENTGSTEGNAAGNTGEGENKGTTENTGEGEDKGTTENTGEGENKGETGETPVKQPVSLTWDLETSEISYDGNNHVPTVNEKVDGIKYTIVQDGVGEVQEAKNPGSYKVTAFADAQELKNNTITFTITKAKVTLEWSGLEATYSGNKISLPKAKFKGIDGEEKEVTVVCTEDRKLQEGNIYNADSYKVKATLTDEQNAYYELSTDAVKENVLIVTPKPVDIIWENKSVTYDGEAHSLSYECEDYNKDEVKITYDKEGDFINAGTYTATATIEDKNYAPSENTRTRTLTISPLEIKVTADPKSKVYGENDCTLTYTVEALKQTNLSEERIRSELGDDFLTRAKCEDVGSYDIDQANTPQNYNVTYEGAKFEIKKLKIKIKAEDKSKVYGEETPALTYTVTDSGNTEIDIKKELGTKILTVKDEKEDVGSYEIVLAEQPKNFEVTCESAELTVEKLNVEIMADAKDKIFGEADPDFTYSVKLPDNAKKTEEDVRDALTVKDKKTLVRKDGETVGKYEISLNVDPKNYNVTYHPAQLEIKKLGVTVKANPGSKIYGAKDPELTYEIIIPEDSTVPKEKVQEELGENPLVRVLGEDAGAYKISLDKELPDFDVTFVENEFEIKKLDIVVTAEPKTKIYGEADPKFTYTLSFPETAEGTEKTEGDVRTELGEDILVRDENENVGNYEIKFNADPKNYNVKYEPNDLVINPLPVKITAEPKTKFYGEADPGLTYTVEFPVQTETTKTEADVRDELGSAPLLRIKGEDVGKYNIDFNVNPKNYEVTYSSAELKINQLPVIITAEAKEKYYGAADPELTYTVAFPEKTETTKTEADVRKAFDGNPLTRTEGENAAVYKIQLIKNLDNYAITYKEADFNINKLPVVITPNDGQEKIFGQKERETYGYTLSFSAKATKTLLTQKKVKQELGDYVLTREAGESVGAYSFRILTAEDSDFAKTNFANFDLTLDKTSPVYAINSVDIKKVDEINSRQGNLEVTTNLTGARSELVSTRIKVEAEFPETVDGISFDKNIDNYITGASDGILFTTDSEKINVNTVKYEKDRKDNKKKISWDGKLPAGTILKVSIVDDKGNTVSTKPVTVTVGKVDVTMGWAETKKSSTGNYVEPKTALVLSGNNTNEKTEVMYSKTKGSGAAASYYDSTNLSFVPEINNSNSAHVMQSVTANVVDTLNLNCTPQTLDFYVDDIAFPISASAIHFDNRGKEITIQLPEKGTITNVAIPGAKVEVTGGTSNEYKLAVSWSGKTLIPTGAPISVTYKDEAGHEGTGTASANRSSVSTPITFRIRPELNANGYLNGQRGNTLIVSGVACACEPLKITVAGMSQTTNAAQQEVWSDSNGSWEVAFDMSRLPEGQDFTISAEYMDVSGSSYSMTAKYEAFVAPATVTSPIYEAMSHISGMVEPGTAVALVINGDTSKYYEFDVDRFGRISMDDVPMMFGGEDSFDIYVQDIAGNVSIQHYDIPQPEDPFEVTAQVNSLGKYFYRAEQKVSGAYAATPISATDFEEADTLELPLIMSMSYEVGKTTITRGDNGIVVTSHIQLDSDIAEEDYKVENEKLYVYRTRPTVDDLRDMTGEEYKYGEEIPLGENETIWLVDSKDMTILAEDIDELELFNYGESKEYEAYQVQ